MIRHIVMWKFREGTEEKADEFLTKLAALELASGEEISGLAFAPDGVSIIAAQKERGRAQHRQGQLRRRARLRV